MRGPSCFSRKLRLRLYTLSHAYMYYLTVLQQQSLLQCALPWFHGQDLCAYGFPSSGIGMLVFLASVTQSGTFQHCQVCAESVASA